jgi:hypothetical protein
MFSWEQNIYVGKMAGNYYGMEWKKIGAFRTVLHV